VTAIIHGGRLCLVAVHNLAVVSVDPFVPQFNFSDVIRVIRGYMSGKLRGR